MIKQKLQELLAVCLDKGVHFDYAAHVNAITIHPKGAETPKDYIVICYSLDEWQGTEEQHIANIDKFIQQVWELN